MISGDGENAEDDDEEEEEEEEEAAAAGEEDEVNCDCNSIHVTSNVDVMFCTSSN